MQMQCIRYLKYVLIFEIIYVYYSLGLKQEKAKLFSNIIFQSVFNEMYMNTGVANLDKNIWSENIWNFHSVVKIIYIYCSL